MYFKVPATADGTWRWSHNVRIWDHGAVATHLVALRQSKRWPRGTARIVLAGVSNTDLVSSACQQVAQCEFRQLSRIHANHGGDKSRL